MAGKPACRSALRWWMALCLVVLAALPAVGQTAARAIVALGPPDDKSVVLCVRGATMSNFEKTVMPSMGKGRDGLWPVKVYSRFSARLALLSSKIGWKPMAEYFEAESRDAAALIRGEIDNAEYVGRTKANEVLIGRALDPEVPLMAEHEARMRRHEALCKRASGELIGEAKLFAAGR